ncbi:MAG: lipopolysaccharide biosynthesis protein [Methylomonas sp.]|nr:MAG: lipopolysaccharide biosynthesis protein [Methylomonas sp.]
MKKARVIALYLPQFHPIPENDEWWGVGFTEWTNTAKAKPLFKDHYQPHVPSDLGFYDLRVSETRHDQAELAKAYGIEGFCYYHYWFAGERLLERPFNEVLASGSPDFPFCLCWANQTWSGIWHGAPNRILKEQTYPGKEDHIKHFQYLLNAFKDDRYIKVDGKPFFAIFKPEEIPNIKDVLALWRSLAVESGLEGIHFVGVGSAALGDNWKPESLGFDASFTPRLPAKEDWVSRRNIINWLYFQWKKLKGYPSVHDHNKVIHEILPKSVDGVVDYPCIIPNWDNTPRSGKNGLVLTNSTPELLKLQIKKSLEILDDYSVSNKIIILKSWNEWAEGNYVEPDLKYGRSYLEAIKEEIS